MKSPLASTVPPPIPLATIRSLAKKHRAGLPPALLAVIRKQLLVQEGLEAARELDSLFDPVTGRPRG
jgi:hypothetical protein